MFGIIVVLKYLDSFHMVLHDGSKSGCTFLHWSFKQLPQHQPQTTPDPPLTPTVIVLWWSPPSNILNTDELLHRICSHRVSAWLLCNLAHLSLCVLLPYGWLLHSHPPAETISDEEEMDQLKGQMRLWIHVRSLLNFLSWLPDIVHLAQIFS